MPSARSGKSADPGRWRLRRSGPVAEGAESELSLPTEALKAPNAERARDLPPSRLTPPPDASRGVPCVLGWQRAEMPLEILRTHRGRCVRSRISSTSATRRRLPFRVSRALRCCIRAVLEVVGVEYPQPLGGPGSTSRRSERGEARHLDRRLRARDAERVGSRAWPISSIPIRLRFASRSTSRREIAVRRNERRNMMPD